MTDPDDGPRRDGPAGDDGEAPDDEELAEMADELSDVLRELRDELRAGREAEPVPEPTVDDGGSGAELEINLPSATDVLAFTDEKLIPAAITILEVNIRALELLQKGIRLARPDKAGENAQAVRSHAESLSRSSLERLDSVLGRLQDAAGEGALPDDEEASEVLTEARRLRDEIDAALERRAEDAADDEDAGDEPDENEEDRRSSPWDDQPEVDVDVEGELESIKAELGKKDDDGTGEAGDVADDETSPREESGSDAEGHDTEDGAVGGGHSDGESGGGSSDGESGGGSDGESDDDPSDGVGGDDLPDEAADDGPSDDGAPDGDGDG